MWPLLLGLWKARCGRKAAVAVIAPFVERSRRRFSDIPETAWLDPYIVGFMMMFITLVTRREVDALDTQALGLVQSGAWGEITGMKSELIGEETLHLCATGNRDFERGCRDAMAFDLALYKSAIVQMSNLGFAGLESGFGFNPSEEKNPELDDVMLLWEHYFDGQIMAHADVQSIVPGSAADIARSHA